MSGPGSQPFGGVPLMTNALFPQAGGPVPLGGMGSIGGLPPPAAMAHLEVQCFGRMKQVQVFPLTVELKRGASLAGMSQPAEPLQLRLRVPGALVSPPEQFLDPNQPVAKVLFYVTPLAHGRLPQAHIEVFQAGRFLQQLMLPMRTTTQSLAKWLLFFAFALPLLLFYLMRQIDYVTPADGKPEEGRLAVAVERHLPDWFTPRASVGTQVQKGFDWLLTDGAKHSLPIYSFLGFVTLAGLAYLLHSPARKRIKGQGFNLAPVTAGPGGGPARGGPPVGLLPVSSPELNLPGNFN